MISHCNYSELRLFNVMFFGKQVTKVRCFLSQNELRPFFNGIRNVF